MSDIYSWRDFVASDFDGRSYEWPSFGGTFTATLACKRWGRRQNLVAYFDLDDGRQVVASAWNDNDFLGLRGIPVGSRVEIAFRDSKNKPGRYFLRAVEWLEDDEEE